MASVLVSLISVYVSMAVYIPVVHKHAPELVRSYDYLFRTADLVIIVEPISVRDATKQDMVAPPEQYAQYLDSFVARLAVLHVIKGPYKEDTLDLYYFRWKQDARVFDAYSMVEFNVNQKHFWPRSKEVLPSAPGVLLFLTKAKDGRYEFVTGQMTPSQSVRELSIPRR